MINSATVFSGIGGPEVAADMLGWNNVFYCEKDKWCLEVLKYYHPKAIVYKDITKTNFNPYATTIDVLTGGFPCQPYSFAGERKGSEDPRHLWPEMLRTIREIRPRYAVGENVYGLLNWSKGLVFRQIQIDLEAEGYETFPYVLPACGVGAPHRRERIFFVAHSRSDGQQCRGYLEDRFKKAESERQRLQRQWIRNDLAGNGKARLASNSISQGLQGWPVDGGFAIEWQDFNQQPAGRIQSTWDQFPTERPLCGRDDGFSSGLPGKAVFVRANKHDGIKEIPADQRYNFNRRKSLKAYGNAIVPQQILPIFRVIDFLLKINRE